MFFCFLFGKVIQTRCYLTAKYFFLNMWREAKHANVLLFVFYHISPYGHTIQTYCVSSSF